MFHHLITEDLMAWPIVIKGYAAAWLLHQKFPDLNSCVILTKVCFIGLSQINIYYKTNNNSQRHEVYFIALL